MFWYDNQFLFFKDIDNLRQEQEEPKKQSPSEQFSGNIPRYRMLFVVNVDEKGITCSCNDKSRSGIPCEHVLPV